MARLEQSSHHQELLQLQALKDTIAEQQEVLRNAKETEKRAKAQLKEIQQKITVRLEERERVRDEEGEGERDVHALHVVNCRLSI